MLPANEWQFNSFKVVLEMTDAKFPGHRFATLYDTAKRCLIVIDGLYSEIEECLKLLSDPHDISNKSRLAVRLYTCVFSMIDFGHRFTQVVDAMPLLPKKKIEVKRLHSAIGPLTACRNYIQHIRNHLSKVEIIDFPILGSISWILDHKNYVILPTQLTEGYGVPSIPIDSKTMTYTCKYQFVIESCRIQLDTVYQEMKTFWNWLDSVSHITPTEVKTYEWGGPNILMSEIAGA
jgi:hypothetical protein